MNKLRRALLLLFCAALVFLLQYVLLQSATQFSTVSSDVFTTYGEGVKWYRYRGNTVVQQVSAEQAKLFFVAPGDQDTSSVLDVQPTQIELQGEVVFAAEGQVLRTARATFAAGKLFSDAPVQVAGDGVNMRSSKGFSYVWANKQLVLLGEVEGEAYPAERTRK